MKKDLVISMRVRSTDLASLVMFKEAQGESATSMSSLVGECVEAFAELARSKGFVVDSVSEALEVLEQRFGMTGRGKNKRNLFENLLRESAPSTSEDEIERAVREALFKNRRKR